MANMLHDLFHGRLYPLEQIISSDPDYRPLNRKISDEQRYFMDKMSLDDCQRFDALSGLYAQCSTMQEEAAFFYGFKLGAALMLAVTAELPQEQRE